MNEADPYNLARFLEAQTRPWEDGTIYDQALCELRARAKRTHWIWFIFPQIAGLGRSPTAQFFRECSATTPEISSSPATC